MTIALRRQLQQHTLPNVSFGPFRFFEAMPWLVLAASMRVIAFNSPLIAIPATVFASIAVLHAFLVVTQRSIELAHGQTGLGGLGGLDFTEQSRLTRAILWRIGLLMLAASIAVLAAGYTSAAPHMMSGLDGMAFDQFTDIGKFWSAAVAALTLVMIVGAERNDGRVSFREAAAEFARRGLWLGAAVIALGIIYLGLGLGQGLIRNALWHFYQTSAAHPLIKNLIFFVFIFSFALLRLWVTLLVLTWGLKQSYLRAS
jgi:F0F1-type ATP synthase membrane subunit c/vacuolar-type H+-ATPase subunit K